MFTTIFLIGRVGVGGVQFGPLDTTTLIFRLILLSPTSRYIFKDFAS
jgi:hypothetical protein